MYCNLYVHNKKKKKKYPPFEKDFFFQDNKRDEIFFGFNPLLKYITKLILGVKVIGSTPVF